MDKLIYKIVAATTLIAMVCYCSAPSTFENSQFFYTHDFEKTKGMQILEISTKIGIVGDEIYIGRPRMWIDSEQAICHCKTPATHLSFKAGKLIALCQKHTPFIHPVNQQKYPTDPEAIKTMEKAKSMEKAKKS